VVSTAMLPTRPFVSAISQPGLLSRRAKDGLRARTGNLPWSGLEKLCPASKRKKRSESPQRFPIVSVKRGSAAKEWRQREKRCVPCPMSSNRCRDMAFSGDKSAWCRFPTFVPEGHEKSSFLDLSCGYVLLLRQCCSAFTGPLAACSPSGRGAHCCNEHGIAPGLGAGTLREYTV
jgi:hypothetical protein